MHRFVNRLYQNKSLKRILWVSFSLSAVMTTIFIGVFFYSQFSKEMQSTLQEETQSLIEQVNNSLSINLRSMMKVSDTLYYSVIKNKQFDNENVTREFQLIYDTNKDFIDNITLLSSSGELIGTAPAAVLKEQNNVAVESWFRLVLSETENMHFFLPKVQTLFFNESENYKWVLSLGREVEMTYGKETEQGVLLIDMQYSVLEEMFGKISLKNGGYLYLIDHDGNIIYHPMQQLIYSGLKKENNLIEAGYSDGNHMEQFDGEQRMINVKTVGYTGWKIIGVTPKKSWYSLKSFLFLLFIFFFLIGILFLMNSYISSKVSGPIKELECIVQTIASGSLNAEAEVTGSSEIEHLAASIYRMADQIRKLMDDIVKEHEEKRKSELDALQSQINPHFLYNTLDIIVWMVENERQSEAVKVVTALARFFRISLSKGKTIILLEDEIEHARNYLMIQELRFKNHFTYDIQVEESVKRLSCIKLIIQPIVENAIYHAMEYMYGDGEIKIKAFRHGDALVITISDNGLGMTLEKVLEITSGIGKASKKGSGIGIRNVDERIQLFFGSEYGLCIASESDIGTTVTLTLPVIPYEEWKGK